MAKRGAKKGRKCVQFGRGKGGKKVCRRFSGTKKK